MFHVNGFGANGDLFTITGTDGLGNTVFPTFTSSATPSYTTDALGNVDATGPSTTGNNANVGVNLTSPAKIISFTIDWKDCSTCSALNQHGSAIGDIEFCVSDNDGDGVFDGTDLDDDNDGILDANEAMADTDGDGIPDPCDTDSDGDECPDAIEAGHTDGDSDGFLGTSPVTVNSTGVVTGQGGYTGTTAAVTTTGDSSPDAGTNGVLEICFGTTATDTELFTALGGTPDTGGTWSPATPGGVGVYTYTVPTPNVSCGPDATATITVTNSTTDTDGDGLTDCEETTGVDDPSTPLVPTGTSDENDPCDPNPTAVATGDCDDDGNPNGTDPNPTVPTATDDSGTAPVGSTTTIDILTNDDYLDNADPANLGTTTITQTGGTAGGTVTFDPTTGTLDYTPLPGEAGTTVTVVYEVCNDASGANVCTTAVVTINVPPCPSPVDTDGDGLTDCEETTGVDDPSTPLVPTGTSDETDPCDPSPTAVAAGDCDDDGNPNGTDPNPTVPTATDDSGTAPVGSTTTIDILTNDDYLDNADPANLGTTTITQTGGTAGGTVTFDPTTGTLDYTPLPGEAGTTVTVVYEVCNDASGANVCTTDVVTITVPACPSPVDTDGDGLTDCEETTGVDDPSTPLVPTGTSDETDPCDPNPTAVASGDCDDDGNPNGTDPNPTVPTATDDAGTAPVGSTTTIDILTNDDYLDNADPANLGTTTITQTGGTAGGTVTFDPTTGTLDYTPLPGEAGTTVTVIYEVCNDASGANVCTTAVVTINVPACPNATDTDGDGLTDCEELTGIDDPSTPLNPTTFGAGPFDPNDPCDPVGINTTDTDGDGLTDCEETTGIDDPSTPTVPTGTSDPNDPCSPIGINTTDTDGDGLTDCEETTGIDDPSTPTVPTGTSDPNDPCSPIGINTTDTDGDGLTDCEETTGIDDPSTPTVPTGTSDPNDPCSPIGINTTDTDGDGLTDCEETTGIDDPSTPLVPTGTSDETDPCDPSPTAVATGDCDDDGNPNGTDPNPTVPTATDDSGTAPVGSTTTIDILTNDDYLDNADPANLGTTTITQTGGTAGGTVTFDPTTGTLDYTPLPGEAGTTVTVIYEVCNDASGANVCTTAVVTINVPACPNATDTDGDGLTDCEELTGIDDPSTPLNPTTFGAGPFDPNDPCDPVGINTTDTDGDGLTDCEETTGIDDPSTPTVPTGTSDPNDPCSPIGINTTDTDGDGLTDCEETTGVDDPSTPTVPTGPSDPNDPCSPIGINTTDTDGDGLTDCEELTGIDDPSTPLDPGTFGVTPGNPSDPNDPCDPIGINTTDTDGDGLTDCEELTGIDDPSTPLDPGTFGVTPGNPSDPDDPCDPIGVNTTDTDGDGLTDCEELTGIDDPSTPLVPTGTSDPDDPCSPRPCDLVIPEGFTPNGDEFNNTFEIEGIELYPDNEILIFNRWGNQVFEMTGYDNTWDGTRNVGMDITGDQLPTGTYYYIFDTKDETIGDKGIFQGFIYMKR